VAVRDPCELAEILCIEHARIVARDNTVTYGRLKLQLPQSRTRAHYVKACVKVREYPANQLGSEMQQQSALRAGTQEMQSPATTSLVGIVKDFGLIDFPFIVSTPQQADALLDGPLGAALLAKLSEKGLVGLAYWDLGFRNVTNSKRAITKGEDLGGIKIRVIPNPVYLMTFKALGADAVPMEFPLVYAALKDGRLDGEENPVPTIANSRFYEVQKYITLTGHFFAPVAFIANRAMFEQLDPSDQEALIAAAKAGAEATWQAQLDAPRLEQLRSGGMDIIEKVDRQPFLDVLKPLEGEFEKRFGKDLLLAIRSTP